ncbi:hypothetical protein MVEN_01823200 [Mycena venus]|uniref:Uncharacterized protein n=1 Tax=Mycena venus TaxID=2733690 RepID=A0A8H6XKW0_9AGAR|nr:hypothetical protein MVEN_01823200 [Mycena venus]
MYIFSVIYLASALMLAAVASPIANKPPANHPSISSGAAPAEPSPAASHPDSTSEGQGDIFNPVQLVNETLPHIGNEEEAKPKPPHGLCVIA